MVKTESTMLALGTAAPDFSLPNVDGSTVSKADFAGKPLMVAFICNHCPFVKLIADKFGELGNAYQDKGVAFIAISSNDVVGYPDDSPEKMKEEAEARGYQFPYLYDESQDVALAYTAACTPDFFLFDANHELVYRGQFDDARPKMDPPATVTGKDLTAALDAVLTGNPIPEPQLPSIGCNIKWLEDKTPAYFGV